MDGGCARGVSRSIVSPVVRGIVGTSLATSYDIYPAFASAVSDQGGTLPDAMAVKTRALLNGIESQGLQRYIKALYLFAGNTYDSAALNAMNPTELVGAFYGTWVGTPTLNANGGFTPSLGNYFTSNFHPDGGGLTDLTGGGMFFYGTSDITGGEYPIGLASEFYLAPNANGTQALLRCSGAATTAVAAVSTDGFHWGGREANSSNLRAYRNGTRYIDEAIAFSSGYANGYATTYARIGGRRDQVTPADNASTMPLRLAGFTKGLTAAQVSALNTLIQNYVA